MGISARTLHDRSNAIAWAALAVAFLAICALVVHHARGASGIVVAGGRGTFEVDGYRPDAGAASDAVARGSLTAGAQRVALPPGTYEVTVTETTQTGTCVVPVFFVVRPHHFEPWGGGGAGSGFCR